MLCCRPLRLTSLGRGCNEQKSVWMARHGRLGQAWEAKGIFGAGEKVRW